LYNGFYFHGTILPQGATQTIPGPTSTPTAWLKRFMSSKWKALYSLYLIYAFWAKQACYLRVFRIILLFDEEYHIWSIFELDTTDSLIEWDYCPKLSLK
jgi:hypothetical protein